MPLCQLLFDFNSYAYPTYMCARPNLVITEPVDGIAPNGAKPSAGTGLTTKYTRYDYT